MLQPDSILGSSVSVGIAALEAAEPSISGALLMLVDQPMVTTELLESLIARWSPPDFPIAATSHANEVVYRLCLIVVFSLNFANSTLIVARGKL